MTPVLVEAFTEETLANLRTQPLGYQAQVCDARVRQIEAQTRRNFVELGLIVLHVDEMELWKELVDDDGNPYHSWDQWITASTLASRSHAYAAKSQVKVLRDNNIPMSTAVNIPHKNLTQFTQLSTSLMRDPEIVKAASTLSAEDFNTKIRKDHPLQHFDRTLPMRFYPTESARQRIDEALDKAKLIEGCTTREEALEALAANYLETAEQWDESHPILDEVRV